MFAQRYDSKDTIRGTWITNVASNVLLSKDSIVKAVNNCKQNKPITDIKRADKDQDRKNTEKRRKIKDLRVEVKRSDRFRNLQKRIN